MARVALVTGGTRGIGAAISRALKEAGYTVAANSAGNDEAAAAFKAETGIPVYKWSVADYDACVAGLAKVEAELGPVEVLINNAGITRDAPFHKISREQWSAVIDTNLSGVFNMTHPLWNGMRDRGFGRIVNISSINGQKGQFAQVNYSAAKAGVIGLTSALAREWAAQSINVNAVAPGYIKGTRLTGPRDVDEQIGILPEMISMIEDQIPIGRPGVPADVAAVVSFLASSESDYVTGQVIEVHGGLEIIKVV